MKNILHMAWTFILCCCFIHKINAYMRTCLFTYVNRKEFWIIPLLYRTRDNTQWPSDSIWRHKSGSTLIQITVCCLTAPWLSSVTHLRLQPHLPWVKELNKTEWLFMWSVVNSDTKLHIHTYNARLGHIQDPNCVTTLFANALSPSCVLPSSGPM